MSKNILKGSKRSFANYCARYKFISIGPKRSLETNNSKKGYLPGDNRFWPTFSRIIECNKRRGALCKGLKGVLTFFVEVIRFFSET